MATLSHKTYPKKSNMSQLTYNYEYSDYDSCTEGMSSDEEEEIDNVFLNECVNDEINNSDDSWTDESDNVEDDTDFSYASAPKKKKKPEKNNKNTKREAEVLLLFFKQGGLIIHSTSTSVYKC